MLHAKGRFTLVGLVVSLLQVLPATRMASFGVQAKLKQDLLGLKYRFQEKGLSEHPAFTQFVEQRVTEETARLKVAALPGTASTYW